MARLNTKRLDGRVVLVTGAGDGIGRATALLCAQRGATLALCDIRDDALDRTAGEARAAGADVIAQRVDVAAPDDMTAFAAAVHDRFEAVDVLVNNAGIGLVAGFQETTLEDWKRLIDVNLMGVVHGCDAFIPAMVRRGRGGHVANVSSAAGYHANPALCAYTTTKFAVLGLSEALRLELRSHGIGVTAICPGIINTAITRNSPIRGADAEQRRARLAGLYERRGYPPERVARNILRAIARDRAIAPVAAEAHAMYALTRMAPPAARRLAARMAELPR